MNKLTMLLSKHVSIPRRQATNIGKFWKAQGNVSQFQSLVGRLQTRYRRRRNIYSKRFQSLVGRLQTFLLLLKLAYHFPVSIPRRQATNPFLGLKIRIFNFLFNFQGAHLKLLKTIIILLSSERRKVFFFLSIPGGFYATGGRQKIRWLFCGCLSLFLPPASIRT